MGSPEWAAAGLDIAATRGGRLRNSGGPTAA
eukprot:CAMPEP_0204563476 /NCGR_PEP_ID=MMETSP0661-20131031/34332_1 /ASSEMBLY_ACC=CAM_ASM_000606 /TAXON_ID=109239 /ORGANISM="Alexandrium margalefi, Strain AMGDE01CS-322" /LENGTH=30 /DNA_ID= /DNA_START= /DNA_END= /DNA_ORIENTATION=